MVRLAVSFWSMFRPLCMSVYICTHTCCGSFYTRVPVSRAAPSTVFLHTCLCVYAPVCMQACFRVHTGPSTAAACVCFCACVCMCVGHPASCSAVKSLTPPHTVQEFQSSGDWAWTALGNSSFWKERRMLPFMVAPGLFCSCLASTRRYILACSGVVTKHARPQPQLGPTTGSRWGRAGPRMTGMPAPASWLRRCWGRRGGSSSPPACPQPPSAFSFCLISCRGSAPLCLSPCLAALKNDRMSLKTGQEGGRLQAAFLTSP